MVTIAAPHSRSKKRKGRSHKGGFHEYLTKEPSWARNAVLFGHGQCTLRTLMVDGELATVAGQLQSLLVRLSPSAAIAVLFTMCTHDPIYNCVLGRPSHLFLAMADADPLYIPHHDPLGFATRPHPWSQPRRTPPNY